MKKYTYFYGVVLYVHQVTVIEAMLFKHNHTFIYNWPTII